MKNHIIFWNQGKAITLALLAPLALASFTIAADEYGDSDKDNPVYYSWTRDSNGRVIGYKEGDEQNHDFIWYRNQTREEKTACDNVTKPIDSLEGNWRDITSNTANTPAYVYKTTVGSIVGDFENNVNTYTTGHGGAIYNRNATIGSIQGYFVENYSEKEGGAIGNYKSTINTIHDSLFLGNYANGPEGGGAICNYDNQIGNIENSTFIGNQAAYDGGAYRNRNGASIESFSSVNFIVNTAARSGGAIANSDIKSTIGVIDKATFTGNMASAGSGGAIYNEGVIGSGNDNGDGTVSVVGGITNSTFSENISHVATLSNADKLITGGGAISNINGSIAQISKSKFENNDTRWTEFRIDITFEKKDDEEAKDSFSETVLASEFEEKDSQWVKYIDTKGGEYKRNTNGGSGAAIYNTGTIGVELQGADGSKVLAGGILDVEFIGNITSQYGGAIYNSGTIVEIKDTTFEQNSALGRNIVETTTGKLLDGGAGGAIYNAGTIYDIKGGNFASNVSGSTGGAIYNAGQMGNIIASFTENSSMNHGGAIYNAKQMGNIIASFTENSSMNHGGAIYNKSSSTISSIMRQEGIEGSGVFKGNQSKGKAGAICNEGTIGSWNVEADGSVKLIGGIVGTKFENNVGSGGAGAVYNGNSISHIYNTTFEDNNSQWTSINSEGKTEGGGDGGAIQNTGTIGAGITGADGSVMVVGGIENTIFRGNQAHQAGAIYNNKGIIGAIINSVFVKNDSLGKENSEGVLVGGGNAGAILNNDGKIGHITADFAENAASSNGGAINNYTADSIIGDIKLDTNNANAVGFERNQAGGAGGAIYNKGQISALSTLFTENKSGSDGGALYNDGSIALITNSTFESNLSENRGGALYNSATIGSWVDKGNGTAEIVVGLKDVDFTKNRSLNDGGAIYNNGNIRGINGGKFEKNDSQWTKFTVVVTYEDENIKSTTHEFTYAEGEEFDKTITPMHPVKKTEISQNGGHGAAIYNSGTIGVEIANAAKDAPKVEGGITGAKFEDNITSRHGGAIYNAGTIGDITETQFVRNSSQGREINIDDSVMLDGTSHGIMKPLDGGMGGAIMNVGTIYSVTGGTFADNKAGTGGGAICNGDGGSDEGHRGYIGAIEVDTFTNNWADYASLGGGAILNRNLSEIGSIKIENLTDNIVGKDDKRTTSGGGGIANYGTIGNIHITNASGNRTWRNNGGVILNWTSNTRNYEADIGVISGDSFHDNFAFGSGGAIHNEGEGAMIAAIEVTLFKDNISMSSGGAVRNYKGAEIKSGKLNSNFEGNYATNRGGALYFEGTLEDGIFSSTYEKNASGNDGGAIVLAESTTVIENIRDTEFRQNRAGVWRERPEGDWKTIAEWHEDPTMNPAISNGGAILNGFRYVDVNIDDETGKQLKLSEWLASRKADGELQDVGSEYYIFKSEGSRIKSISNSTFVDNTAGYTLEDEAAPVGEGVLASGGAIANGYIDHYISPDITEDSYDFWLVAGGNIDQIYGTTFTKNKALYRGGAIYNIHGKIGDIENSTFTGNKALRQEGTGDGGAIFNNQSASIGNIKHTDFTKNEAGGSGGAIYNELAGNTTSAFPVALGASGSIEDISSSLFTGNMAGQDGGGIYNLGVIGKIRAELDVPTGEYVGGFAGNTAGTKSAEGAGGGVYNGESGTIEGFWNTDFTGNKASSLGTAFTNIGWTGKIEAQETMPREYDNIVEAGLTNTSFTGNKSATLDAPYGDRIAALYTETNLAIIAKDKDTVLFDENVVGKFSDGVSKEADIYVGKKDGETPDIYMIAEQGSMIHTRGEIDGDDGYVLRLRGSLTRGEDILKTRGDGNNTGGTVHFDGLVKKADVIMDDVTLIIGHEAENHRAIDTTKEYVAVYDDSLEHNDNSDILYPEDVDFKGNGGEVGSHTDDKERLYSDVLRNSRLEARSGRVMTADDDIVNYNIGTIVSNGRMSYDYEGEGYYSSGNYTGQSNPELYATWSININLNTLKADTFTTWYKEDNEMAQSKGYMTLSGCRIDARETSKNKKEDWVTWRDKTSSGPWKPDWKTEEGLDDFEHHDHSQDDWVQEGDKFFEADEYPTNPKIEQYYDALIQVINLIKLDADGKELPTPEEWKKPGSTTESAPLQLDLGKLTTQERETPYMSSDDLLCEGIGYGTTKTYHDSIHIWGWRDNLAAWSELQESLTEGSGDYEEYGKQFHIKGEHLLTRNIKRYYNEGMKDNLLLQEKELMLYGDDWNSSVLNVGGFNLISEVAKNQTLELRHLTIVNVGTGDVAEDPANRKYSPDTIWQKTYNEGTYILDNLHVDVDYAVVNDSVTIKRGTWDAYNIYTSYLRSEVKLDPKRWADSYDAVAGTDAIDNELHLQMDKEKRGTTHITGTIEYNNVHNDEGAETYLKVHEERDYRKADGSTHFVDPSLYDQSATTGAFQRFYCNSLIMNAGNFYLVNLNYQELMLRDLIIGDGTIHINATTVDLEKEEMGRIWAYHDAQYTGTGHIIVEEDALVIKPKDGISDAAHYIERDGKRGYETPVRFANKGVARSVVPFGKMDDYLDDTHTRSNHYMKEGKTYWYEADYCYEDVDDFKAGYYYYRRWLNDQGQSEFVPGVQVGPVAEAAGALGSMQQVHDHVFEHADLFADSVYSTQKERLRDRSFTVVTPTKGKNAVAALVGRAAPKASLCGGKAGFKGGLWVRPYAGYEKQPLSGGPKVTNSLYGALVGGDTALTEHRNGWASVFSAHAAYLGSTQKYSQRGSGVRINQNGGGVGVTGTLYYKNFYTALSGTVATASGHANSSTGTENFRMLLGGVTSRSGYNIEFGKGRFVLQPTLLLAFTTVHMPSYTNAAGARISSDPLYQLQVHPYVKLIMRTESCWVPYLTLGYVYNILGKTSYYADGVTLPEMSVDPYVEYSLGVQKTWADLYTIFGQLTGRHGGRNGLEVSVGFRYVW